MKILIKLVSVLMIIVMSSLPALAGEIGISSGPQNLAYYAVIAKIKKGCPDLDISNHSSTGGLANIGAMGTRLDIRYGIAPYDAMDFKDRKEHAKMSKYLVLAPLYQNGLQILASDRSGIKTIKDTNGKRGNIGPVGSGSWLSSQLLTMTLSLSWITSTYSTTESLKKLLAGELDFIVYFSGVPTPDLRDMGKDITGIHLVDVYDPKLENSKYYTITEIAGGTYGFEPRTVRIPQVQNYLIVRKPTTPEQEADDEALLSCIAKNLDKWSSEDILFNGVSLTEPPKWQMHPALNKLISGGK